VVDGQLQMQVRDDTNTSASIGLMIQNDGTSKRYYGPEATG
jgi:hypothetical protein